MIMSGLSVLGSISVPLFTNIRRQCWPKYSNDGESLVTLVPTFCVKFPRGVVWYWIGFRSSKHQNILVMCFSPRLIMWGQGIAVRHQNDSHQKCMQCTKTKRDNAMFFFEIKRTFRAAAFPHILACSKTNNAAKPELSMSPRCLANIMRNFYFLMRVSDFLNIIKGITFF